MENELISQINNICNNNLISRGIFIHTTSIYQTTLFLYSLMKKENIKINTLPIDDLINRPVTQLINIDVLNHKPTSSINSFFNYKTTNNNNIKCLLINNIDLYVYFKNYHIILKNLIDVLSPKHSPLLTIPIIFISNSNTAATNELSNYCKNIDFNDFNIYLKNDELINDDTCVENKSLSDFNKLLHFITLKKLSTISVEDCLLNNICIIINWYVSKCINNNSNNSNNSNNNYIYEYLNYFKNINTSTDKLLTFEYVIDQLQNKYNNYDNDCMNNNIEQIYPMLIIQTNEINAHFINIQNTEIYLLQMCNKLQINKQSAIKLIKSLNKNNKLFNEYIDKLQFPKNTLRMLIKQYKD